MLPQQKQPRARPLLSQEQMLPQGLSHQSSPYHLNHLSLPCKIHVLGTSSFSPEPFIFRFAFILLAYLCDPFYFSFKLKIGLLFSFHFRDTGHLSQSMHACKYCHTVVTLTCLVEGFLTQTNDTGADWDHHWQLLPHQRDNVCEYNYRRCQGQWKKNESSDEYQYRVVPS